MREFSIIQLGSDAYLHYWCKHCTEECLNELTADRTRHRECATCHDLPVLEEKQPIDRVVPSLRWATIAAQQFSLPPQSTARSSGADAPLTWGVERAAQRQREALPNRPETTTSPYRMGASPMPDAARYETRHDGYCRWRSWESTASCERYVYVHRLLATLLVDDIDELADRHVHHVDHVPYHNSLDNLEVRDPPEHAEYHLNGRAFADGGER